MLTSRWLAAAPPDWDELCSADPNATASHRPALWAAVAAVIPAFEARWLELREEGRLVGGLPLVVERRPGAARVLAMPWVLPGAPLARPGAHPAVDAAAAEAFGRVEREERAGGGLWSLYRPEGPEFAAAAPGTLVAIETALIPLGAGLDAAWRDMDRKTRQGLARSRERLAIAEEPAALAEAWTLHARQARGWAHRPLPIALSRRLLDAPGAGAHLFTARDSRGLLSAVLALDGGHETFLWWSGTRAEGRARHAFGALAWRVAEWALARGRRRLNLGASPDLAEVAAFKRSLGALALRYPVRWLEGRHAPWPWRALAALRRRAAGGRR